MKRGIVGHIIWRSKDVFLDKRVFLFCFGEKCMSGRINKFHRISSQYQFEIDVDFIEPAFFQSDAVVGSYFVIREASNVLGEGTVKEVD
jgi:hypothetical protein